MLIPSEVLSQCTLARKRESEGVVKGGGRSFFLCFVVAATTAAAAAVAHERKTHSKWKIYKRK